MLMGLSNTVGAVCGITTTTTFCSSHKKCVTNKNRRGWSIGNIQWLGQILSDLFLKIVKERHLVCHTKCVWRTNPTIATPLKICLGSTEQWAGTNST